MEGEIYLFLRGLSSFSDIFSQWYRKILLPKNPCIITTLRGTTVWSYCAKDMKKSLLVSQRADSAPNSILYD